MELSIACLKSLKERDEAELWELAAALLQFQHAIFRLEVGETDPKVVRMLAERTLSAGQELNAVLAVLEETIQED